MCNMEPHLIKGGIFNDERGTIQFVNNFNFHNISRFYIIENSKEMDTRAWQAHKVDVKNFYCISGSFLISCVKIDNWDKPSNDLPVSRFVLTAKESQILRIPPGYANAIKSLELGSKLLSFSTLPLSETKNDDVRYDKYMWASDLLPE